MRFTPGLSGHALPLWSDAAVLRRPGEEWKLKYLRTTSPLERVQKKRAPPGDTLECAHLRNGVSWLPK